MKDNELYRCPTCGTPLFREKDGKKIIRKQHGGKSIDVEIEVMPNNNTQYTIRCKKCGAGHIFLHINETISINEEFEAEVDNSSS